MLPSPPKVAAEKPRFDPVATLIRRRKAAVTLLVALSVAAAALAVFAFAKLMPVRGDASHSAGVLARTSALEAALRSAADAVSDRAKGAAEAQRAWTEVSALAPGVTELVSDDAEEEQALAWFRVEQAAGTASLTEGVEALARATRGGEGSADVVEAARAKAKEGINRIAEASAKVGAVATRQLDLQMNAARVWLGVCIALVLLTGLMMGVTVLTWAYADYADRARARRLGQARLATQEAVEAAERLCLAIENGPLAVVEWNADSVCTRWSGKAAEMFGRPASEAIGKPWREMTGHVHPDDLERLEREMAPLLRGETDCVVIRHRNLKRDGTVVHCVWYNSAVGGKGGAGSRTYLSLADDVTRTVEVEEAFRNESQMVRRIADNSPFGISVNGADGRLLFANGFIMDLFGLSKEQVTEGRGALPEWKLEELDGTPIPNSERPSSIVLRTGQAVKGREVRVISPFKDKAIFVSLTAVPLRSKNGTVDAVLILHEDIASRVAAESEREELAAELNRARRLETVGNLASGIAHDFGNALLAISYSADTLGAAATAGHATAEQAAQLKDAIAVARELTDSLVNYAAGRDGTKRPLDLAAFVRKNCKFVGRLLPAHFKVVCELPEGSTEPAMVNASGPQLLQVLMNLAVNARDAMPLGGSLTLRVSVDRAGGSASPASAVLEVIDTGQGMTPEVSGRAFDRYFTTKEPGAGSGIGLPTVRQIVQDHGGTVELHSEPERGTRFTIRLPLVRAGGGSPAAAPSTTAAAPFEWPGSRQASPGAAAEAAQALAARVPGGPSGAAAAAPQAPAPSASGQLPRAMVVESDERVRPLIVQTLRNSGYQVESFSSAEKGLEVFMKSPSAWSVVLLELDGSGTGGTACLRQMRQNAPELRALMLTVDPADASGRLVDGRTRVLLKPFTVGSLRSALNDLLDRALSR